MNPNASRHGRFFELHFNDRGRISGAKVLTYGLDKSRLNRLGHEERTYHIFYQLLAGATPTERDFFALEDPSDYALLASSGTYRLPSGPFSDDAIAMDQLREDMKSLGFKPRHVTSIFSLLVAILLLSNLQFADGDARDVPAYVTNTPVLDQVAKFLGVPSDDLAQTLTNKTSYVRKELYTVLMNAGQSALQRDHFARDLYAILFAFVVETANHRVSPSPPPFSQIILMDQPGFQSRGSSPGGSAFFTAGAPLIHAYGQNGFDEFCINFADELLHSYMIRMTFEDTVGYNGHIAGDGVSLPTVTTVDNSACVELLRGAQLNERAHKKPGGFLGVLSKACSSYKSGKSGDKRDDDLLQELVSRFGVHTSFISSPSVAVAGTTERNLFGINHYAGSCSYDATGFVEKDTDILDSAFVTLLRNSSDPFISKLFAGPSLAAEKHSKDENMIVQAQVSSRPLRHPTPVTSSNRAEAGEEHPRLDPSKVYPVTTQLNFTLSEIIANLDLARLWTVSCIRPNDSGSPNSFDKRRVKTQIRSLLLPNVIARRKTEYVVDLEYDVFCERYVPTAPGSTQERIQRCVQANGWREGVDFALGHRMIWLAYGPWKTMEDGLRSAEKELRKSSQEDEESNYPDDNTDHTHQDVALPPHSAYYGQSDDNLLLTRVTTGGTQYRDPNINYGQGGLPTPGLSAPSYKEDESGWGSEYDKKEVLQDSPDPSKEGGLVVKDAPNAIEEVPTSRSRRFWLYLVWATTWWIPSFCLSWVGRMKRPDIRLAWREKVTIFFLIFLINATVIFYIVEFGRLLCPDFNKAWDLNEVAQHTGTNDYWVTIHGQVYDVSNFILRQHSDITGEPSNAQNTLETLAGLDLTGYFPIPLVLGCPSLVSDANLIFQTQNFSALIPTAVHTSGAQQSAQGTQLDASNWYTAQFLPTINQYHKGPLVYDSKAIASGASDQSNPRLVYL